MGQFLTALKILRPGACLVLKTYTFTKKLSVTTIAKISQVFESFKVVKPSASKILNSEVYLIGINLRNDCKHLVASLIDTLEILMPKLVQAQNLTFTESSSFVSIDY